MFLGTGEKVKSSRFIRKVVGGGLQLSWTFYKQQHRPHSADDFSQAPHHPCDVFDIVNQLIKTIGGENIINHVDLTAAFDKLSRALLQEGRIKWKHLKCK